MPAEPLASAGHHGQSTPRPALGRSTIHVRMAPEEAPDGGEYEAGEIRAHPRALPCPRQHLRLRGLCLPLRRMHPAPYAPSTRCTTSPKATPVILIRKSEFLWHAVCQVAVLENEAHRANRRYGRALWTRYTEWMQKAGWGRLRTFSKRLCTGDPDRETAEIQSRAVLVGRSKARSST